MINIKAIDKNIYYISRSIDNTIIHHGEIQVGEDKIVSSGQPLLETYESLDKYEIRLLQLGINID